MDRSLSKIVDETDSDEVIKSLNTLILPLEYALWVKKEEIILLRKDMQSEFDNIGELFNNYLCLPGEEEAVSSFYGTASFYG